MLELLDFLTEKKRKINFLIGQKSIQATWQSILKATQESTTALILNGDHKSKQQRHQQQQQQEQQDQRGGEDTRRNRKKSGRTRLALSKR